MNLFGRVWVAMLRGQWVVVQELIQTIEREIYLIYRSIADIEKRKELIQSLKQRYSYKPRLLQSRVHLLNETSSILDSSKSEIARVAFQSEFETNNLDDIIKLEDIAMAESNLELDEPS